MMGSNAHSRVNPVDLTQKTAEQQIRHLLEPLLDKYCHDECKLMNVNVTVDIAKVDSIAPGFDDTDARRNTDIAPSSAQVKLLMNDKIGPVSRRKLLDLVQQYLDTLDYPIHVDTQIAHFPMPQGSEGKIAEMRERISKQFQNSTDELLHQFCPQSCILADYNLQTEVVNGEEAQYGSPGEFIQDGDTAIRIKNMSATVLMDQSLSPEEQSNILQMVKLKTGTFKNVDITGRSMKFPRPMIAGTGRMNRSLASDGTPIDSESKESKSQHDSKSSNDSTSLNDSKITQELKTNASQVTKNSNDNKETSVKEEKYNRVEKIERVENGDAVQAELAKFKVFGIIFSASVLALLIFIALSTYGNRSLGLQHKPMSAASEGIGTASSNENRKSSPSENSSLLSTRYEIERIFDELTSVFAQQPKVAKQVFTRVLTEEGVEFTAECIHLFGEGIVIDMLRDPSLQTDIAELMDYYAKNPIDLKEDQKLELLRKLHARTVTGKLTVLGSRSSNLFDFLAEMDGLQILELVRSESLTVKAIILTQCDSQKRSIVYSQMDADTRMRILPELSRIDYLPKDFIFNVANALKRKKRDNPKLNTEALPGSEVLVSLLERTSQSMQKVVIKNLENTSTDSARTVKSKLVSVETLKYLRDGQLLEVILSLKHDELIQFLKGTSPEIRSIVFMKSPKDLAVELEEELEHVKLQSREAYLAVERKILNRIKIMANEGQINLVETNERMFNGSSIDEAYSDSIPSNDYGERTA